MGVAASLIFITAGAILAWAVSAQAEGIDLQIAGIILFIIGAIGLLVSLLFWGTWGGWGWNQSPLSPPPGSKDQDEKH